MYVMESAAPVKSPGEKVGITVGVLLSLISA